VEGAGGVTLLVALRLRGGAAPLSVTRLEVFVAAAEGAEALVFFFVFFEFLVFVF